MKKLILLALMLGFCLSHAQNVQKYMVLAKPNLNVRSEPNEESKLIGKIPEGTILPVGRIVYPDSVGGSSNGDWSLPKEIGGKEGFWHKIEWEGKQGFVFSAFICPIDEGLLADDSEIKILATSGSGGSWGADGNGEYIPYNPEYHYYGIFPVKDSLFFRIKRIKVQPVVGFYHSPYDMGSSHNTTVLEAEDPHAMDGILFMLASKRKLSDRILPWVVKKNGVLYPYQEMTFAQNDKSQNLTLIGSLFDEGRYGITMVKGENWNWESLPAEQKSQYPFADFWHDIQNCYHSKQWNAIQYYCGDFDQDGHPDLILRKEDSGISSDSYGDEIHKALFLSSKGVDFLPVLSNSAGEEY
ncbi:MAG: SH3 domain-containing protein [Bacteroidia bacterium]|nr:SH3 domain-containing protein [Bacteroidia bacterium]